MRFMLPLIVLLVLVGSEPARAASVTVVDGALVYSAVSSERNRLVLTSEGTDVRVSDPGASGLAVGPGCSPAGPARTAACPASAVRRLVLAMDNANDVVQIRLDLPSEIEAGSGDDEVTIGGGGDAILIGGAGNDRLTTSAGDDVVQGEEGDDTIRGGAGNDRVFGGAGADEVEGEAGDDALAGQLGRDLLSGGPGADRVDGGDGGDSVDGGADPDRLVGAGGADVLNAADQGPDEVDCGEGADSGRADTIDALAPGCERLELEAGGAGITRTMLPYPIIRIVGEVVGSRTRVRRLQTKAPVGSSVHVRCRGGGCPYRTSTYRIESARTLTISDLERRYAAGARIEVYVTAPDRIGKYTRFIARRNRAPGRTDRCVAGERLRAVRCGPR